MTILPTAPAASAALLALRERFRGSAGTTVAGFAALAARLAQSPAAPEVLESLRRELHRVRGTAGSYGFMDASRLAEHLEGRVMRWAAEPALDVHLRAREVEHFAAALRTALDAGCGPAGAAPSSGGGGRS